MDNTPQTILELITKWLPLIQGFAALVSIGGATVSWRYAFKAKRAREEMTQNIIMSRLLENFTQTSSTLQSFRKKAINERGNVDKELYSLNSQLHMHLLEETTALAKAATEYLVKRPAHWQLTIDSLSAASRYPNPEHIEDACKKLVCTISELKLASSTREMAPTN